MSEHSESVDKIKMGVLSDDEVVRMSVVQIEPGLDKKKDGTYNTIFDPRMGFNGAKGNLHNCPTCNQGYKDCPGHFGCIKLVRKIYNPIFFKDIVKMLKIFCHNCGKFILEDSVTTFPRLDSDVNFKEIINLTTTTKCFTCNHRNAVVSGNNGEQHITFKDLQSESGKIKSPDEVHDIFSKIHPDSLRKLKIDPLMFMPKNLIMQYLPVMPPSARPSVSDEAQTCDDDLSGCLQDIIKFNNRLWETDNKIETKKKKKYNADMLYNNLKGTIASFFNNSTGKNVRATNGRAIKGISDRLKGKEGRLRKNIMGKRVDFSARTVISPDPSLSFGEVGIPKQIANILTFPERVTSYNINFLTELVNTQRALSYETKNTKSEQVMYQIEQKRRFNIKTNNKNYSYLIINGVDKQDISVLKLKTEYFDEKDETGKKKFDKRTDIVIKFFKKKKQFEVINPEEVKDGKIHYIIKKGKGKKLFVPNNSSETPSANASVLTAVHSNNKTWQLNKAVSYMTDIKLKPGDIVNRFLIDGDVVLLNRQPTLHKGSMMAKRVRILPKGKTFRLSLESTKSFNADFDGDEMNIHVPQSYSSRIELMEIAASKHNIISDQGSVPNIAIVQDSLTSAYLMTTLNEKIERSEFFNYVSRIKIDGEEVWGDLVNRKRIQYESLLETEYHNLNQKINKIINEEKEGLLRTFENLKKNISNFDKKMIKGIKKQIVENISNTDLLENPDSYFNDVLHKKYETEINKCVSVINKTRNMKLKIDKGKQLFESIEHIRMKILDGIDSKVSVTTLEKTFNNVLKLDKITLDYLISLSKMCVEINEIIYIKKNTDNIHSIVDNIKIIGRYRFDQNRLYNFMFDKKIGKEVYCSNLLLSILLPETFSYKKKTKAYPQIKLEVKNGIITGGYVDKNSLGSSPNSLIQMLLHLYDNDKTVEFITNIQFVTNDWIKSYGFSMGIEDVLAPDIKILKKVEEALEDSFIKASAYASNIINDHIREAKQLESMQETQKKTMNIVEMQRLDTTQLNNLEIAVISGAKGTNTNRLQTQISVGQQHLSVGRIPLMLDGIRTLPHYPKEKSQMTLKEMYESRGFISNSLTAGLNAQEFFFYAMAGRENICDTAMGTPLSGYIQRRLVKIMEDFEIMYDNTVRDVSTGDIIQLSYGDDDVACNKILQVDGKSQMMNISSLNDMLSTEFELNQTKNKHIKTKTKTNKENLFDTVVELLPNITDTMVDSSFSTVPVLTKYEYSKLIQIRAEQISRNTNLVKIEVPKNMINPGDIARLEFKSNMLPFKIVRTLPDGNKEYISYQKLIK